VSGDSEEDRGSGGKRRERRGRKGEERRKEYRKRKIGGKKGKWDKRGQNKLIFGQNVRKR
jgi:hypothetical protein